MQPLEFGGFFMRTLEGLFIFSTRNQGALAEQMEWYKWLLQRPELTHGPPLTSYILMMCTTLGYFFLFLTGFLGNVVCMFVSRPLRPFCN